MPSRIMGLFRNSRRSDLHTKNRSAVRLCTDSYPVRQEWSGADIRTVRDLGSVFNNTPSGDDRSGPAPFPQVAYVKSGNTLCFDAFSQKLASKSRSTLADGQVKSQPQALSSAAQKSRSITGAPTPDSSSEEFVSDEEVAESSDSDHDDDDDDGHSSEIIQTIQPAQRSQPGVSQNSPPTVSYQAFSPPKPTAQPPSGPQASPFTQTPVGRETRKKTASGAPVVSAPIGPPQTAARPVARELQHGSECSHEETPKAAPRISSALELRLDELQEHYNRLKLEYVTLTSSQMETHEAVLDIKSDLCITKLSTEQNRLEIVDLQESRLSLANELSILKITVESCQKEISAVRSNLSVSHAHSSSRVSSEPEYGKSLSTAVEVLADRPRRMTLTEYKQHCVQRYLDAQNRLPEGSPAPQLPKSRTAKVVVHHGEEDDEDIAKLDIDVLAASGTSQPMKMTDGRVSPATTSAGTDAPPAASEARHHGKRATHTRAFVEECEKSKERPTGAKSSFKTSTKDRLSAISYFRKFKKKEKL